MGHKMIRCPHPAHEDKNPSCAHYEAGTERERWYCFACQWSADRVQYDVDVSGLSMREAMEKHKGKRKSTEVGPSPAETPPPDNDKAKREAKAKALWAASVPIKGTPAAEYLHLRGIRLDYGSNLRYHPSYPFPGEPFKPMPAMVARIDSSAGDLSGVQGRSLVGKTRGSRGRVSGRGCYLGNREHETLLVGEGVLTVLSAWQLTGIACCPVACMGGGMGNYVPPETARQIIIAADNDAPGLALAEKLQRRIELMGMECKTIRPTAEGVDFNDWLMIAGDSQ